MENYVIYSPSSSVQTSFFSAVQEGRYFLRISVFVCFFILWKLMGTSNRSVSNFLQNIFLCVQQNNNSYTGLEQQEGE